MTALRKCCSGSVPEPNRIAAWRPKYAFRIPSRIRRSTLSTNESDPITHRSTVASSVRIPHSDELTRRDIAVVIHALTGRSAENAGV